MSISGSEIAAEFKAISADHLEVSDEEHLQLLKENQVIAVVLPGASLGLGIGFAPARKMLDLGYSFDEFGELDKQTGGNEHWLDTGDPSKIDRYGKKYSWIAYFERFGIINSTSL